MSTANGFDPWRTPAADSIPTVLPADEPSLSVVPAEELRPPHPGFWMALVWSFAFFLVVNIAPLLVFLPILLFRAQQFSDSDALFSWLVMNSPEGEPTLSPGAARDLAPAVLGGQVISVLFAWMIIRLLVGRDWKREMAVRLPSVQHLALILIGIPAFLILPEVIVALARAVLPTSDYQKQLNEMLQHWPLAYGVLAVGFGAGIGEELWCRGFLGRGLLSRYGYLGGVVLTSVLFGLMHVDPPHAVGTAFMGVALHFVYLTTRSLVAPIIVHTLNNGIAFLLVYLSRDFPGLNQFLEDLDRYDLVGKLPLYGVCTLLLGAVGWALYRSRTRVILDQEVGASGWQPQYPGVELPPAGSGAALRTPKLGAGGLGLVLISLALFVATFWWTAKAASGRVPKSEPARAVGSLDSPCLNKG